MRTLNHSDLLDISEQEFLSGVSAQRALLAMTGIEQKFDLLFSNYADYERELLDLSLREVLQQDRQWQSAQDEIAGVSRRLANLLSAARLYLDQVVGHDLLAVFGQSSSLPEQIRAKAAEQYDTRLGYRAMEGLRNVVQHRSMPVHRLTFPNDRVVAGWVRTRVIPSTEVSSLRNVGLKPDVLAELEALGKHVALTPLVRDYVEGLGTVHEAVRSLASDQVAAWDEVLASMQARGTARWGGGDKRAFLLLHYDTDPDLPVESVQVFTDISGYRRAFERRNRLLGHRVQRFVSSECSQEDA